MYKIVEKKQLNHQVFLMTIEAPFIAKKVQPGQFIILRIDEFGERIPLTVEDFDCENGTITIVFQAVGFTTQKLASLEIGSFIADCVGPLGCPTEFGSPKKAIVIGGGVGCAIAYPQAKALFNIHDFSFIEASEKLIEHEVIGGIIPIRVIHEDGSVVKLNQTQYERQTERREAERRQQEEHDYYMRNRHEIRRKNRELKKERPSSRRTSRYSSDIKGSSTRVSKSRKPKKTGYRYP